MLGWVEGFELNFFALLGFDISRPALKLPALGRLGVVAGLFLRESPNLHVPPLISKGRRQASVCARLLEGKSPHRPQAFDRRVPFGRAFDRPRSEAGLDSGIADRDVRADFVQDAAQQRRDLGRHLSTTPPIQVLGPNAHPVRRHRTDADRNADGMLQHGGQHVLPGILDGA
jgi:hypothetical protein